MVISQSRAELLRGLADFSVKGAPESAQGRTGITTT